MENDEWALHSLVHKETGIHSFSYFHSPVDLVGGHSPVPGDSSDELVQGILTAPAYLEDFSLGRETVTVHVFPAHA